MEMSQIIQEHFIHLLSHHLTIHDVFYCKRRWTNQEQNKSMIWPMSHCIIWRFGCLWLVVDLIVCLPARRFVVPPCTGTNGPTTWYNPLLTRPACILVISLPSLSSYVFSVHHHRLLSTPAFWTKNELFHLYHTHVIAIRIQSSSLLEDYETTAEL